MSKPSISSPGPRRDETVIGCINWGLVGLFRFDLVAWLFGGSASLLSRIVYTLVGLAGLWCITFFFRKAAFREAD